MDSPDSVTEGQIAKTTYLRDVDAETRDGYRRRFLRTRPYRTASLFLYVIVHRHGYLKTFAEDVSLFRECTTLAGVLEDAGITHLHAPWADRCAFVAMIAAPSSGIPYSVQARAHDLHRERSRYGLASRLGEADFVVTNSDYNAAHIAALVGPAKARRIRRIYEASTPAPSPLGHGAT